MSLLVIDLVKNQTLLFLEWKEKGTGKRNEIEINGSPKVNVPEDKPVASSMVRQRKEKMQEKDTGVHHPPDGNPAIRMISIENPENRMVNKQDPALRERLTIILRTFIIQGTRDQYKICLHWHPLECTYQNKGNCNKVKKCVYVCSSIPKEEIKAMTRRTRIESISTTTTRIMQRGDSTREARGDPTQ